MAMIRLLTFCCIATTVGTAIGATACYGAIQLAAGTTKDGGCCTYTMPYEGRAVGSSNGFESGVPVAADLGVGIDLALGSGGGSGGCCPAVFDPIRAAHPEIQQKKLLAVEAQLEVMDDSALLAVEASADTDPCGPLECGDVDPTIVQSMIKKYGESRQQADENEIAKADTIWQQTVQWWELDAARAACFTFVGAVIGFFSRNAARALARLRR